MGVNINSADYDGRTAFHLASAEEQIEVLKFLLNNEKLEFKSDNIGDTPLHDAIRTYSAKSISYITQKFKLTNL